MRRKRNDIYGKKKKGFHFLDLLDDDDWDDSEDDAYYAEDDAYYEDDYAEDETVYASEDYEDEEVYASEEYAEDEAAYASEEYTEDDGYYAEDEMAYESEEYINDEEVYVSEEYAQDDTYYAEDDAYYYEEDYAEEEYVPVPRKSASRNNRGGRRSASGRRRNAKRENKAAAVIAAFMSKVYNMSVVDRVLMGTGAAVLAIAVVTCSVFANVRSINAQVASFVDVGERMAGIGVVGESGLMALTDAELAVVNAVEEEPEEEQAVPEFSIGINMTSVEKDLKIKFVDTGTGKLISGIPFEVKVTGPSGKSDVWTDDDKDGIIYRKDITPGKYQVSLLEIDALKEYTFSGKALNTTVKDKIEYKQIDVADEIKSESEVNAALEDTAQEVVTEEVLKDTVEWVESTKTEVGTGDGVSYEEIKKGDIPEPTASARAFSMQPFSAKDTVPAPDDPTGGTTEPGTGGGETGGDGGGETTKPAVESVSISGPSSVKVGETISLTATVSPADAPQDVTWTSSNSSIASVSGGTVTGVAAGPATITATAGGKSANVTVTVEAKEETPVIKSVEISGGASTVKAGESTTFTATVKGEGEVSQTVTWSSSNDSIATVSGGKVTGVAAGSATITATAIDGKTSASVEITVTPKEETPTITGITIEGASEVVAGGTITLTAKVEGTGNFSDEVTWSSSKKDVATIDGGKVTGVAEGTTTITATTKDGNHSATKEIKVTAKPAVVKTVTVTGDKKTVEIGKTITLTAKVEGENSPSQEVTWKSADDKIATVTEKGEVKGVAEGKVKITATSKADTTISGTLEIEVTKAAAATTIKIPETLKLYTDKTGELTATVTGSAEKITWTSSDKSIATVTESGEKATVKAVKAGSATITAAYGDAKATCKVTVVQDPKTDKTTVLKDKNGNVLYIKDSNGNYVKATLADYYTAKAFYKQVKNVKYKYTGWQTIDGKTYYFDKNGNPVKGDQVILGAKYVFASDGSIVKGSGTMGIDVSKWNGNINWGAVKNSGVSYVIIRCGYRGSSTGALIEDPMFRKNIQGASAAGLKIGIYFFTQAISEVEAVEEASMTINLIKKYGISYPVFIDVEGSGGRADGLSRDARTNIVNAYCKTIQNAGYKAGIYANKTWLESKMNMGVLNSYKIWLAQYNSQYTYKGKVDLWQYSSSGSIGGISGRVDMNISYLGY